ncbi:hypothetical protein CACET_c06890 [Clostridium aceticum]|uniref:Uncharacterized protein n=1 Tax=Clostridium aceticum TaxID=84022 RepID=A0A0D8IDW0_9CLOT|nr:hypothetical protein [Clostridium aceticum]AKL94199.1 hypothetical protein CACET_c06890 [Clostridium aceticum]KJF28463.1 hypothetical protein TZ02_00580 [Clostridium aceticum]
MVLSLVQNNLEKEVLREIKEIQDLKRKINEVKQTKICEESSLLLQIFDMELSKKIENYTYCQNIIIS